MCGIEFPSDDSVIIGLNRADDAGVYRITDDIALVQSVDFFTPIVDDPFRFGQIAAANALSDIYAMGGTPKTAMNLVAFPSGDIDLDVLKQILKGGIDKLREADAVLIGGHSVQDRELKYGLSVTGTVHPARRPADPDQAAGHRHCQHGPQGGTDFRRTCRNSHTGNGFAQQGGCGDYEEVRCERVH